jgi:hypothetical protein
MEELRGKPFRRAKDGIVRADHPRARADPGAAFKSPHSVDDDVPTSDPLVTREVVRP